MANANDGITERLLSISGEIDVRAMMGDHVVYFRKKVVGGVYDGRLMVKIARSSESMLGKAERAEPYEGAKQMLVVPRDHIADAEMILALFEALYADLPPLKRKSGV